MGGEHVRGRAGGIRITPAEREAGVRVRVGLVGPGDRAVKTHLPVLTRLSDRFELAGVATLERREDLAQVAETFGSIEEMVRRAKPDLLVSCVPPGPCVTDALLEFGLPLLVEAPLAWSLRDGRTLERRVRELGVPVGVAEQMPYLPSEELKARLREAGVFGRILAVHNDRHSAGHHGIAQLRRYLGTDRRACEASATRGACLLSSTAPHRRWVETWQTGSVRYDDGGVLHHQLGGGEGAALSRIPGSLRIHGERASMIGDELRVDGHDPVRVARHEERRGGATVLRAVSIEVPELGEIRWENPFRDAPLDDPQIAVAAHLDAMRRVVLDGGEPLYGVTDALRDVEILRAMRISATLAGAPVALPVRVPVEGLRLAAKPRAWLDQLRGARLHA